MKRLIARLFRSLIRLEERDRQYSLRKKYSLPDSFRFNGQNIQIYGEGIIKVGENSYIGSLSTVQLHKDHIVYIGDGCSISHNVRIYTSSKVPDGNFRDKTILPEKRGDIIIGDFVWIGANVFINPGVKIGNNSVVGANSVITKDIEANAIYGGVPAKLIRFKRNDL